MIWMPLSSDTTKFGGDDAIDWILLPRWMLPNYHEGYTVDFELGPFRKAGNRIKSILTRRDENRLDTMRTYSDHLAVTVELKRYWHSRMTDDICYGRFERAIIERFNQ